MNRQERKGDEEFCIYFICSGLGRKKKKSHQCLKGKLKFSQFQVLAENKSSSLKWLVVTQSKIISISTKGIIQTSV